MQASAAMDDLASAIGIPSEEAALVAELKAAPSKPSRVHRRYRQPLYSLIARSLQDPADAADITQEVFIKVFRGIRQLPRRVQPAHLALPHRAP